MIIMLSMKRHRHNFSVNELFHVANLRVFVVPTVTLAATDCTGVIVMNKKINITIL